jgi:hypothetical protein
MIKMKKILINRYSLVLAAISLASCSDQFLEDKQNYDQTSTAAYEYYSGASGRVDDVYSWCLPNCNQSPSWKYVSTGLADDQSQSTEEYSGFGAFVNPQTLLSISGTNPPDYFQGQMNNIQQSAWGRIRNINDVIRGISNSSLSQEEKNELLGQVYFLRAWCYYNFVKWYGGVPIITDVQDPVAESVVPRSSTKECIDFIISDLDKSAELLEPFTTSGGWGTSAKYGRVTTGTALALKGRVLLLWASPLFNRTNDSERWTNAYNVIKESISVIESCGYGLAHESDPGVNASGWANMFVEDNNKEAVFVTLHNTIASGGTPDYQFNNNWEHGIRPSNAQGGGGKNPSAMLVDMFPMADGKRPALCGTYTKLDGSSYTYNDEQPFMNRDPRFYRTFAFPGVRWTFNGDPTDDKNNNPYKGSQYELWNYVWYTTADDRDNIESSNKYGADNLLSNAKGMYVRKRTDDLDINSATRYIFESSNGFKRSATPYMEIRFAEVLLNYAEAACGAGHMDEAVAQLKRIRARVGYTADSNYGLQASLTSDQAACMSAVLYERQIELAYEGKRFDDLRRWMLFDGGQATVTGAPSTWKLTGWGGNTCTYLGFKQLNGQRRENLEFRVKADYNGGLGGKEYTTTTTTAADGTKVTTTVSPDPLVTLGVTRPSAINLGKEVTDAQWEALRTFYNTYLERNKKKGDSYDSNHSLLYVDYEPYYYFLGLCQSAQSNNPTLEQTIGWSDYINGNADGTFDPLAE